MEKLKDYIEKWIAIEGQKPCNEDDFVNEFIKLINHLDDHRDVSFDGEGSYFGKQITLQLNKMYYGDPLINFEIAYSKTEISVYNGNHNGYWNPEYIRMTYKHSRFQELKTELFKLLTNVFGI